ncbi:hypothetical protein GCM10017673_39120 [Streptosporangium violaceochromogenes]|nr:hypothetical protein GCM10017673_39120 [Streptosporangium violaceochromogenes]
MTAAQAAARAAREHGVSLSPDTAEHIAAAVLEAHDTTYEVRQLVPRETWQHLDYRRHIQRDLRRSLLQELADSNLLPVTLPTESLRYLPHGWWSTVSSQYSPGAAPGRVWLDSFEGTEVPAEHRDQGAVDWETVVVTLKAPARKAAS